MHTVFGKINYGGYKIQQLILGTATAIWWVTEPHSFSQFSAKIFKNNSPDEWFVAFLQKFVTKKV